MLKRNTVIDFLNDFLRPQDFEDGTYNGLQIEGKTGIKKIGFAVDSSQESFQTAVDKQCDMLIVHHGLIWGGIPKITGMMKTRLDTLLNNNINLYVSHLPLDKNPQCGNNVRIIDAIGGSVGEEFVDVGYISKFDHPLDFDELIERIKTKINPDIRMMPYGEKKIQKVAVSSGGFRASWMNEAYRMGVQTILTGEGSSESLFYHQAREQEMNIIFAGHYATETFGLEGLRQIMSKQYELENIELEMLSLPTGW